MHGVRVVKDKLYYTIDDAVLSVPYTVGQRTATGSTTKVADLSTGALASVGIVVGRGSSSARTV